MERIVFTTHIQTLLEEHLRLRTGCSSFKTGGQHIERISSDNNGKVCSGGGGGSSNGKKVKWINDGFYMQHIRERRPRGQ